MKSLDELTRKVMGDEFADKLQEQNQNRSLSKALFSMRNAAGVTQAEMAKKLGCTVSAVSKIEHADNASIKAEDIASYRRIVNSGPTESSSPNEHPSE